MLITFIYSKLTFSLGVLNYFSQKLKNSTVLIRNGSLTFKETNTNFEHNWLRKQQTNIKKKFYLYLVLFYWSFTKYCKIFGMITEFWSFKNLLSEVIIYKFFVGFLELKMGHICKYLNMNFNFCESMPHPGIKQVCHL